MADYNTAQRRRNLIVGAFVIIAFAAFIYMIWIFGELPMAVSRFNSFNVIANFPAAPGIQQNTPIYYCGYQVGRVIARSAPGRFVDKETGETYHKISVTMAIDKEFVDIPSNADIKVMKRSMGSSFIELQVDPERPLVEMVAGRPETTFLCPDLPPLKGSTGMSSEFFPKEVQKKLEDLVDSLVILVNNTNDVIGDEGNKTNVKNTLANLTAATRQAKDTLASVQSFSDRGSLALEATAEDLGEALADFRKVMNKINEGEGSLSRLLNDGRLYENLLDSSEELRMTLEQFKKFAAESRETGLKIKL